MSDSRTQIGPLSRFVQALAPTLAIIAGPDGRDSGVVPVPVGDAGAVSLDGLRVAFYTEDGETPTAPDTAAAVREAAEALRQFGARVTEGCPANVGRDALEITRHVRTRPSRRSGDGRERWRRPCSRYLADLLGPGFGYR